MSGFHDNFHCDDDDALTGTANAPDPSDPDFGTVGTIAANGLPIWSAYRTAAHIANPGGTWTNNRNDLAITYSFSDAANIGAGFEVYTAAERVGARYAMDLYADVSELSFVEAQDIGNADITFRYIEGWNRGGGWANTPGLNRVTINIGHVSWEPEMLPGTYILHLQLHELGHAMGLAHPGTYNGAGSTYADADYWNDTRQYSNMSYWDEGNTGADFGYMATLGLHDILAIQMEYGVNWSTRDTDTVYGYNSTAGLASYDLTTLDDIAFSIWDGGGEDTLDFSGSNTGTEIDLRDGAFSSVNGQTYNVSIAYGVVVENGIGSALDDTIIGNGSDNVLRGGAGDDTIIGGLATQPDFTSDIRHFTGIGLNRDPLGTDQYLSVSGVDAFSGSAFTLEMMVDLERMSSGTTPLVSYATSASSDAVLIEAYSGSTIAITIMGSRFDTRVPIETLVDGLPHRVSMSWEKASGALSLFVDGESVFSSTHRIGARIPPNGTLIFGQEQDRVGGGFDAAQTFQGTVGDIRVFDTLRTAAQIETNAFGPISPNSAGLQHNWQASGDAAGSIADSANGSAPLDLTINGGATIRDTAPILDRTSDDDHLLGGDGNDTLDGGWGDDHLEGQIGNDTLTGGDGEDRIHGGRGNDRIVGGDGADTLDGGYGSDILDYSASGDGVVIALFSGIAHGGDATGDEIGNFERVLGSRQADVLIGDSRNNVLWGLQGDDKLRGGRGDDHLVGAQGADTFVFQTGDGTDMLYRYEPGKDRLVVFGSTFDDLTILRTAQGAEVGYGNGDIMRIQSATRDAISLTEDDFVFL